MQTAWKSMLERQSRGTGGDQEIAAESGKIILPAIHATEWIHWITELRHHHSCRCAQSDYRYSQAAVMKNSTISQDGRQQAHNPSLHVPAKKLQFDKNDPKAGRSTF
ncbi:hypothetical protein SUGI_0087710 [Cryptomeria japonica]|nr:hypothetical protein SUGI_0087710 [Cryptomeria japonica]